MDTGQAPKALKAYEWMARPGAQTKKACPNYSRDKPLIYYCI
jgi:hypothetical protein